ncbi:hypothetical protein COO72_07860 [Bifidobacterium callitrichos]|nr:hypothetical protein COO72_07860 [Bifidobacterium callitrichos]
MKSQEHGRHLEITTNTTSSHNRDIGADLTRSLAIFCVIGVHALPQTVPLSLGIGRESAGLAIRTFTQFVQLFCQIGVPLFIAITGYLMLDRDYSGPRLKRFITNNLVPIIVSFELWNLLMATIRQYVSHDLTIGIIVRSALLLGEPTVGHLWYLQMIIGAYCAIPVLSWVLRKAHTAGTERYLIAFTLLLILYRSIIPTIESYADLAQHDLGIIIKYEPIVSDLSWILIPLLIGYALKRGMFAKCSLPLLITMFIASAIGLTIDGMIWLTYGTPGTPLLPDYRVNDIFILFATLSTFALIEHISSYHHPQWIRSISRQIAQQAYGIYVIHFPIIWMLSFFWHPTAHNWINFILYFLIALIPSSVITAICMQIPIINKWLFLYKKKIRNR